MKEEWKNMKEEWKNMLFVRFYIKNCHTHAHAQRLPWELVFLMKFNLSQNPITLHLKLLSKSVFSKVPINSGHLYDILTNINYIYSVKN